MNTINVADGYPKYDNETTQLLLFMVPVELNELCNSGSAQRQRRDVNDNGLLDICIPPYSNCVELRPYM